MAQTPLSPGVSIISEMITPALLILASASLLGTVLARLSRVVDYVRKLEDELKQSGNLDAADRSTLQRMERRADLAEHAMISCYIAVSSFVLTCLVIGINRVLVKGFDWLPVSTAILGVTMLLVGSGFMVAECRLAVSQVRADMTDLWAKIDETK